MPADSYVGGASVPRGAKPARHTSPAARTSTDVVTLGEVEERIWECDQGLAELVEEHYTASRDAAEAKADWYGHRDKVLVQLADNPGKIEAQDIREARCRRARQDPRNTESPTGDELYRTYKILEAHVESIQRAMYAVQARMSALQTLHRGLANIT
jgi:hypothetical protein